MTTTGKPADLDVKPNRTPYLPPLMSALNRWRNEDQQDYITLSRTEVVQLIEETRDALREAQP